MKIAVVGFGATGREMLGALRLKHESLDAVLFDDNAAAGRLPSARPFNEYLDPSCEDRDFYVGLGYFHLERKLEIIKGLLSARRKLPALVHPMAFVDPSVSISDAAFVGPMANIDVQTVIGRGAVILNSSVLSHDNCVGEGSFIASGVVTSGWVEMGECVFLGAGATVSNKIKIGAWARIGIGTVVTKDVPNGVSAIGYPMRLLDTPLNLT